MKTIESVDLFIKYTISCIVDRLSPTLQSSVRFHGAVADGERTRRLYYSSTSSSSLELKWVEIGGELSSNGGLIDTLFEELFNLMKIMLSRPLSEEFLASLKSYIQSSQSKEYRIDCLRYATKDKPLLNLVFTDTRQSTFLLQQSQSHIHQSPGRNSWTVKHFVNIMSFLESNCRDLSCWREPLLVVLEGGLKQGNPLRSQFLLDLMSKFTQGRKKEDGIVNNGVNEQEERDEEEKEQDLQEIFEFITQGVCVYMFMFPCPCDV